MKKKGLSVFNMLLLFALVPLVISIVVLTLLSYNKMVKNLESETKTSLQVASNGLKEYYENMLKEYSQDSDPDMQYYYDAADGLISGADDEDAIMKLVEDAAPIPYDESHAYVDSFPEYGIELTLFVQNTRFMTSIKDSNNKRIEGTAASDAVWAAVSAGKEYYSNDVTINNKGYYVVYLPIYSPDGELFGMAFAGTTREAVSAAKISILITSIMAAAILLVLSVVLVVVFANMFAKPLSVVAGNVEKIGFGDLGSKQKASSNVRETLQLIESQEKLQNELADVISKSRGICSELNSKIQEVSVLADGTSVNTDQISCAMSDLADGTIALANNVQDLNIQVDNLGGCINDISSSINVLAESSDTIKSSNDTALEYMEKVSDSSDKSVESIESIANQIIETNKAIIKIDEAVGLITSVASQTNLLALNASIEAARAGEAGKGFAVVAGEIQKLSEESNRGANQIKNIVIDIKNQSDISVELSDNVKNIIAEEQEYILETKNKFDLLNNEVSTSLEQIRAIKSKNETLVSVKEQLVNNVNDLSAISEENAASNEEVSASLTTIAEAVKNISESSSNMAGGANDLEGCFDFFRL